MLSLSKKKDRPNRSSREIAAVQDEGEKKKKEDATRAAILCGPGPGEREKKAGRAREKQFAIEKRRSSGRDPKLSSYCPSGRAQGKRKKRRKKAAWRMSCLRYPFTGCIQRKKRKGGFRNCRRGTYDRLATKKKKRKKERQIPAGQSPLGVVKRSPGLRSPLRRKEGRKEK